MPFATLSASGAYLGPYCSDSTRVDDIADAVDSMLFLVMPRAAVLPAEERAALEAAREAIAEALESMRPGGRRPVILGAEGADVAHCGEVIDTAAEALESVLPPFVYVGTAPGDGACFGIFVDVDGAIASADGSGENLPPADTADSFVMVNDHGNVAYYESDGAAWREVWAVV